MKTVLTPVQARILGCLLEKEMTTPDYYPLTLNSLTAACNQKSNRDPAMSLSEQQVQSALTQLISSNLAGRRSDPGARVSKYGHSLTGTLTRPNEYQRVELAIICELLVRGPQTPGELRSRAARMFPFPSLEELMSTLSGLENRDIPVVRELARQPGRREARFACTWLEVQDSDVDDARPINLGSSGDLDLEARVSALEAQVAHLAETLQLLQDQIDH